jgi:NAD(P)-dependent dehydrogenase (short-subunit alcohol dehydrogenase family)
MFTIDLADELAGTGVTATCLHPATYMNTTMVRRAGVTPVSTVEQGAEAILNRSPGLPRWTRFMTRRGVSLFVVCRHLSRIQFRQIPTRS